MKRLLLAFTAAILVGRHALAGAPPIPPTAPYSVGNLVPTTALSVPAGAVNLNPQGLINAIRDIATVTAPAGAAPGRWAFVGDSTTAGHCAVSCLDKIADSFPYQIGNVLNAAGIPATTDSFFGCDNQPSLTACVAWDPRRSYGAGWVLFNQVTFGGNFLEFPASTAVTPLTFTPAQPWNQIDLYYITGEAVASFVVDRAGVTTTGSTITTTASGVGIGKVTLSWSGTALYAPMNINAISNATGKFFVLGAAFRDTNNPKIEIYNGGIGSSSTVNWTTGSQASYGTFLMLASTALNPDVTFNALGINDWNTSVSIPTYITNQTTLQTQALSTGDSVFIFPTQSNPINFASVATQATYGAATLNLSAAANGAWFSFQYRWKNWTVACNANLMGVNGSCDDRHPRAAGYKDQADMIAGALITLAASYTRPSLAAVALSSPGNPPGLTGTCSTSAQVGGNTSGTFQASCTAQTVIITFASPGVNGWSCNTHDLTTPADTLNQTASSQTSCTLTGTTLASDVISFNAVPN